MVAQLVQVEGATPCHHQRVGQQFGRVQRGKTGPISQVFFGIGLQCKPALRHRPPQPHGGEHIVQGLARAHMHAHIARGHQRHAGELGYLLQAAQRQCIVSAQPCAGSQPHARPRIRPKQASSPYGYCASSFHFDSEWQHQQHLAVRQQSPLCRLPVHAVLPLGSRTAGQGDELAQITPAGEVVRQGDQGKGGGLAVYGMVCATVRTKRHRELRSQQKFQPQALRRPMRTHHPGHRAFIRNGQRAVAQSVRPLHQFLRLRRAALEAEIGQAM